MAEALSKMKLFSCHGSWSSSISDHNRGNRSSRSSSTWKKSDFYGRRLVIENQNGVLPGRKVGNNPIEMTHAIGKSMRWWVKGVRPNMKEIASAQDLVESLSGAKDQLVVVGFFSPGCGGCKSLHPKISQFAEQNPNTMFLQVNYEEHQSMCYSLRVHVLPFFRFYRGAHGHLCSFSCTIATIKKFKDALAKHGAERGSLGPAKGLEESDLLALAANKDLFFSYSKKQVSAEISPQIMKPSPSISEFVSSEFLGMALAPVGRGG